MGITGNSTWRTLTGPLRRVDKSVGKKRLETETAVSEKFIGAKVFFFFFFFSVFSIILVAWIVGL